MQTILNNYYFINLSLIWCTFLLVFHLQYNLPVFVTATPQGILRHPLVWPFLPNLAAILGYSMAPDNDLCSLGLGIVCSWLSGGGTDIEGDNPNNRLHSDNDIVHTSRIYCHDNVISLHHNPLWKYLTVIYFGWSDSICKDNTNESKWLDLPKAVYI